MNRVVLASFCILGLLFSSQAPAGLINGDFSSGTTAWVDASISGAASVSGSRAQLDTGPGVESFSSVLVQGDDGFFNFPSPISLDASVTYLNFDVGFLDLGADVTETGPYSGPDSLFVNLYHATNPGSDIYIDPLVDASIGAAMRRLHFDVSSLAGEEIALSFELSDENDGRNSRVYLDNITFTAQKDVIISVPEPSMLLLLSSGILLMGVSKWQIRV